MSSWRIASQGRTWSANDLSGNGSALHPGRWNSRDQPIVYSSSSIALACLETVVHLAGDWRQVLRPGSAPPPAPPPGCMPASDPLTRRHTARWRASPARNGAPLASQSLAAASKSAASIATSSSRRPRNFSNMARAARRSWWLIVPTRSLRARAEENSVMVQGLINRAVAATTLIRRIRGLRSWSSDQNK
ncbi:MAG TPA: hypothetical protein DDY43_09370 [Synechococcales bacterium UBA10510]|nr:hypothetical protein [Synechococcales bacterium UBA10510]